MKVRTIYLAIGAALALASKGVEAQVPPSGLQLGAVVTPFVGPAPGQGPLAAGGLRVNSTVAGYSAHGLLLPEDVLHAGWDGVRYLPFLTIADIEAFKSQVGAGRYGAIQVYRPGVGYTYLWVTFTPVGGTLVRATFVSEEQRPGARDFFESRAGKSKAPPSGAKPQRKRK